MLKINQRVEATIEEVAFGGDGVARVEGQVLFVPFALPGERVLARVEEVHRSYARARIREMVAASPGREKAPCPYYGACGGCRYQHMSYDDELRLKQAQVVEVLRRIGKFADPAVRPIIRSPQPYGYRNRITVHVENGEAGFRGVDPRDFVPVEKCLLAGDSVNQKLSAFSSGPDRPGKGARLTLRAEGHGHGGFQQVNALLAETLRDLVGGVFSGKGRKLLEGYSGDGLLTGVLAGKFLSVACVEWDSRAVEQARKTAAANVRFFNASCEAGLPQAWKALGGGTDIDGLVDPPREGLGREVRQFLADHPPQKLAYLSCNPATLARDLRELSGTYQAEYFQPVDMFPRTAHVECLAVCHRR
jgi:23S rRNA (uracil1939-C5)-methyltransferase